MTGKIFINYRRGDDPGNTGRLFDRLQDVFPSAQLFMDVDNIAPGLDFVRVLNERVAECDILLAVIGKTWTNACDAAGTRRLDDPDDFVRIEIESALTQGKRVIPVLVGEAHMPRPEDLPESLQALARRNAVRLTHERFRADTQGLIKALQQSLEEIETQRREQAEAVRRAQLEEERRRHEEEAEKERGALAARQQAFAQATTSADPAVLRSFIETYGKGADVAQVSRQLRKFEPSQHSRRAAALLVGGALAAFAVGTGIVWQIERATGPVPVPASASAPVAETPAQPRPDESSWLLLKDTIDEAALNRFIMHYPDSPLRADAEGRIAVLEAERAAKAASVAAVERTNKEGEAQPGNSPTLPQVEEASPEANAPPPASAMSAEASRFGVIPGPGSPLVAAIKTELKRVGCYVGAIDDDWASAAVTTAVAKFVKAAHLTTTPDQPTIDFFNAVRSQPSRICPLQCAKTETESNGACVAKTCPTGQKLDNNGDCIGEKNRAAARNPPFNRRATSERSAPAESSAPRGRGTHGAATSDDVAKGNVGIICGRFGCKAKAAHPAPAGIPCAKAIQDRNGAWRCT